MIDLLQIYVCSRCGEILSDEVDRVMDIDVQRDDVYVFECCRRCSREARPKMVDGQPSYKRVDHERWLDAVHANIGCEDFEDDWPYMPFAP